jgi:hypothetical protein
MEMLKKSGKQYQLIMLDKESDFDFDFDFDI